MQAITISIDSKFDFQLQCPLHPLQGVISYCVDELCNQALCISCIASHCQSHFIRGSQPKLEDAGKLYIQFSDALQSILKETEKLQKNIATLEACSKQEKAILDEIDKCKKSMHNLIEMIFDQKIRNIQNDFFGVSSKLNDLKNEASSFIAQISSRENGAKVIQQFLQQNKIELISEELEHIRQKNANEKDFMKSYKVIVEHDLIKRQIKQTLDSYIQIYEEKNIFEAMNVVQKPQEEKVQDENCNDYDKTLEAIRVQLMSNLVETKTKKIFSENPKRDEKKQDDPQKEICKMSVNKKVNKGRDSQKARSPFTEINNIDIKNEDSNGRLHYKDVVLQENSKSYSRGNSFLNQYANNTMEEEWPTLISNTPARLPISLDPVRLKAVHKEEMNSSKKIEEEYSIMADTNDGTLDLPNENSFIPLQNRTSFDSLSQETYWGSDSKNLDIRDFFTIEHFASDRESDTLSRSGSTTNDFDTFERKQIIEKIESDFSIKAENDVESGKIGFLYYFQWRSKLMHIMQLDQIDRGIQHPRFETHKLNIDFLIPDYHGSILLPNKRIYIIGGQSLTQQGQKHKETYKLNLEDMQVSRCADLISARDSHSLTFCDGYIYALGGIINDSNEEKATQKIVTERCERYDIQNDSWTEIKSMEYPICNQCSCVFNKKYIFTFGGRTSSTKLINKIFRYTIATDSWLTLHMKPADRIGNFILTSQACCRQINSKHIFVFGGYSEERNISNQSFILEIDEESSEKGRRGFEIKYINKKRLIFAAPFWEKQPIIHNNKLYCLQNIITHSNPKLSYCISRRVLCFDGKKWSSIC